MNRSRAVIAMFFCLLPCASAGRDDLLSPGAASGRELSSRVAALVGRLASPAFDERQAAYQSLLDLGVEEPDGVLALLSREPDDPDVKAACRRLRRDIPSACLLKRAIEKAGEDESMKESARRLLECPSPEALAAFTKAWGDSKMARKRETVSRILLHLLQDGSQGMRLQAMRTLSAWGVKEVLPDLERLLSSPDAGMRRVAAHVMGRIGDPSARTTLAGLLADRDPGVRGSAAEGLGLLGDKAAAPDLLALLEDSAVIPPIYGGPEIPTARGPRRVQIAAAEALTLLKAASAKPEFKKRLSDPDPVVRAFSVSALGGLGDGSAVQELLGLLDDRDGSVRVAAVQALGRLGERSAIPRLAGLLESPDPNLPTQAALALQKILGVSWPNTGRIEAAKAWWKENKDDPAFAPRTPR